MTFVANINVLGGGVVLVDGYGLEFIRGVVLLENASSALTADADSGAGLQGGLDDDVPRSDGDANLAPSEGCTTSDRA